MKNKLNLLKCRIEDRKDNPYCWAVVNTDIIIDSCKNKLALLAGVNIDDVTVNIEHMIPDDKNDILSSIHYNETHDSKIRHSFTITLYIQHWFNRNSDMSKYRYIECILTALVAELISVEKCRNHMTYDINESLKAAKGIIKNNKYLVHSTYLHFR